MYLAIFRVTNCNPSEFRLHNVGGTSILHVLWRTAKISAKCTAIYIYIYIYIYICINYTLKCIV